MDTMKIVVVGERAWEYNGGNESFPCGDLGLPPHRIDDNVILGLPMSDVLDGGSAEVDEAINRLRPNSIALINTFGTEPANCSAKERDDLTSYTQGVIEFIERQWKIPVSYVECEDGRWL
jgi:hypothetical protein